MGHHRKGEDRGSVDRPGPRNARIRRGKNTPPRNRNSGRKSSGGKVIPLRGQGRPGGAKRGATRARRPSSIGPEARTAVGHRRLWMVAAVFAVTGFLLGGRAVHISLTDDENYRAFADEQVERPRSPRRPAAV
jgi:hypothetical protein